MVFKGYPERGCRNLAFNSRINYTSTSTCCMLRHADAPIKNRMLAPWTRTKTSNLLASRNRWNSTGFDL